MSGGAVSGSAILGGAEPELSLDPGGACRDSRGGARLRLVRGRLGAHARARGAGRWAAGRAGRAADRAPLRLSPRPAFARQRRRAEGSGVGARAPARPRRRHRGPPFPPTRPRAARRDAERASTPSPCSETTTSQSRATRSPVPPSWRGCRRRCSWTSRVTVERRGKRIQIAGMGPHPVGRGAGSGSRDAACGCSSATIRG